MVVMLRTIIVGEIEKMCANILKIGEEGCQSPEEQLSER
jgi:hypothetical protein